MLQNLKINVYKDCNKLLRGGVCEQELLKKSFYRKTKVKVVIEEL